jgi:IrrE N-terminal-like domain
VVRTANRQGKFSWRSAAARRLCRIAGDPSTISEAVRIVGSKFLEGVRCPPTDLDAVRLRLNIRAVEAEDLPFSGELRRDKDGFRIVCSNHLSPTRRRFTIAHEIAHAILETTGPRCPRVGDELERICDRLASELLMPRHLFLDAVGSSLSIEKIFELARLFDTSLSATAIRCAELLGVSAFGTEGKVVSWAYGVIRKGAGFGTDVELMSAVARASDGQAGQEVVYLRSRVWTGEWRMEWAPTGRNGKAVFLLQPCQSARRAAAT